MSRLLSAGFTRLFKNRLFQSAIVVMFAVGCFAGYTKWSDFNDGRSRIKLDVQRN